VSCAPFFEMDREIGAATVMNIVAWFDKPGKSVTLTTKAFVAAF